MQDDPNEVGHNSIPESRHDFITSTTASNSDGYLDWLLQIVETHDGSSAFMALVLASLSHYKYDLSDWYWINEQYWDILQCQDDVRHRQCAEDKYVRYVMDACSVVIHGLKSGRGSIPLGFDFQFLLDESRIETMAQEARSILDQKLNEIKVADDEARVLRLEAHRKWEESDAPEAIEQRTRARIGEALTELESKIDSPNKDALLSKAVEAYFRGHFTVDDLAVLISQFETDL